MDSVGKYPTVAPRGDGHSWSWLMYKAHKTHPLILNWPEDSILFFSVFVSGFFHKYPGVFLWKCNFFITDWPSIPARIRWKVSLFISLKTKQSFFIHTIVFASFSPIYTKTLANDDNDGDQGLHMCFTQSSRCKWTQHQRSLRIVRKITWKVDRKSSLVCNGAISYKKVR